MNNIEGHTCITGASESGHCGAASYCKQPYRCCAACPEPCNGCCGWLNKDGDNHEN